MQSNIDKKPFVFVCGAKRSGTTLLELMLSSHPCISIIPETYFIAKAAQYMPLKRNLNEEDLEKLKKMILTDRHMKVWKMDTEVFMQDMESWKDISLKNIVEKCILHFGKKLKPSAKILGSKKPTYVNVGKQMKTMFFNSKFLIITRDGRAVSSSIVNSNLKGKWTIVTAALDWRRAVKDGAYMQKHFPENVLQIQYESLIRDPEQTCKVICSFLSVEYDLAMLEFYKNNQNLELISKGQGEKHGSTAKPLMKENISKWKKILSAQEIQTIEYICKKELQMNRYETQSKNSPPFCTRMLFAFQRLYDDIAWLKKRGISAFRNLW